MTKKADPLTKAICNKGFSVNSSVLSRSKFGVGGQESSPQSLTAYSLNRWTKPPLCRGGKMMVNLGLQNFKQNHHEKRKIKMYWTARVW